MSNVTLLYERFLDGSITPQELSDFWQQVGSLKEDNAFWQEVYESYNLPQEQVELGPERAAAVLENIMKPEPASKVIRAGKPAWIWAAACMLAAAIGLFFYKGLLKDHTTKTTAPDLVAVKKPGQPIKGTAILAISGGQTINIDTLKNSSLYNQLHLRLSHDAKGTDFLVYEPSAHGAEITNTLRTYNSKTLAAQLSDGTKVWLNAQSSLKFPVHFKGNYREVYLNGEAYFEVAKKQDRKGERTPFVVHLVRNDHAVGTVEVLGTHFNVKNYADEHNITCVLLEGSIRYKDKVHSVMMHPGQQLTVENEVKVDPVQNVQKAIIWKDGQILLDKESVEEIMNDISRWYGVEIQYNGTPPHLALNGILDRSLPLADILNVLNSYGLHCQKQGNKIVISQ